MLLRDMIPIGTKIYCPICKIQNNFFLNVANVKLNWNYPQKYKIKNVFFFFFWHHLMAFIIHHTLTCYSMIQPASLVMHILFKFFSPSLLAQLLFVNIQWRCSSNWAYYYVWKQTIWLSLSSPSPTQE